jgi:nitrogen regulatory protein PII
MKEIKACIKAIKQEEVTRALHRVEGLTGASFSNFGRIFVSDVERSVRIQEAPDEP